MARRYIWKHWNHLAARVATVLVAAALVGACSQARETIDDAADNLPGIGEESFQATLTGAAERPGPGDANGSGTANVTFDMEDGEVCYDINVSNVDAISAAHIHRGSASEAGPPVVNFEVGQNGLDGCVTGVARQLLQDITSNPDGYYVNVHNATFPAGALRGQLRD